MPPHFPQQLTTWPYYHLDPLKERADRADRLCVLASSSFPTRLLLCGIGRRRHGPPLLLPAQAKATVRHRQLVRCAGTMPPSAPGVEAAPPLPRRRFVIDCDPGVDDAIALLMAVSGCSGSDADQLLAVTTTHGNVGLEQTTRNACKVLDVLPARNAHFDARTVPIHKGCSSPLIKSDHSYFPWHGVDGLGDAGLPDAVGRHVHEEEHAALALIRLCNEYPGEITLVVLGPMTNVALAVRLDPTLPSKVKEMLWMGGALKKGNVSLTSEFNVHKDPEAAHIVLSSFPHSSMICWEMTEAHTVEWQVMDAFLAKAEASCNRLGAFLRGITKPFVRDRDRWEGALICDAVCMAVALDPSIVTKSTERFVDVELEGKFGRGMTVVDWEGRLSGQQPPNVRIVETIEMGRFHELLLAIVDTAARLKQLEDGDDEETGSR